MVRQTTLWADSWKRRLIDFGLLDNFCPYNTPKDQRHYETAVKNSLETDRQHEMNNAWLKIYVFRFPWHFSAKNSRAQKSFGDV